MKELSIEEKATRYDKAIKRVEDIETGKCQKPFIFTEGLFDYIFPELKESEDERIMKALYKMAKVPRKEIYEAEGITKEQALAWLEKQGEKPQGKSALEAINEKKVDNANKVEPKQEKLTEFEKAVKQVMEEAIECGDTHNLKADAEMLLSLVHKSADKVKPRYSTGDVVCDKLCTTLNKDAQPNLEIVNIEDGVYICDKGSFPISQQDNYELVSKKIGQKSSWSEEDEKLLDKVIKRLHKYSAEDEEYLDKYYWLIELKHRVQPQNTWKPSDEQIKVLVEVLIFAANHESPHWQDYIFGILKNLTRQLMKLREE